jgi:predicted RNase H-like HicB family nuclease
MKIKIVVHEAEEGGFWAEVPAIPGCASQGDSMEQLMQNLREAIEGCWNCLHETVTRPRVRSDR